MARFDKLSKYKEALETGMNDVEATYFVNALALAAEPEIDLKEEFDKIDRRFAQIDMRFLEIEGKFDMVNIRFKYIWFTLSGILLAIVWDIVKNFLHL